MKKLLLVFALLLTLTACGGNDAKKVISNELSSIHKTSIKEKLDEIDLESLSTPEKAYAKQICELLSDFDYEFIDVIEKDNAATVKVKIKCFNAVDLYEDFEVDPDIKEIADSIIAEYTEEKEQELTSRYAVKINKVISTYPKDYEAIIEVPCVKTNGEWTIDPSFDLKAAVENVETGSLLELLK